MKQSELFFEPEPECQRLQVSSASEAMIRHEVLFEDEVTRLKERPLFIGAAYARRRFRLAFRVLLAILVALTLRAAWMQLGQQRNYVHLAEANRLRQTPVWPRRGVIYDAKGRVLAENTPRFQVTLTPHDLPRDADSRSIVLGQGARLLGTSMHELVRSAHATSSNSMETYLIADQLPYAQAMEFLVALPDLPGFHVDIRPKRHYPYSTLISSLSHVLGYVGRISPQEYESHANEGYRWADEIGKMGIERSYESALRGTVGQRVSEVDAGGHMQALIGDVPATDGKDLQLSLDLDLQRLAETSLRQEMADSGVTRGSVVAMDPRDGRVLALVSWPAFDDNDFSGGVSSTLYRQLIHDPSQPLFPRAWSGAYPSGSTVKIVISAAALAEGIITPETTVLSTGGLRVGPWFFPDWKAGGHGLTNVRKAIALSVNTFYYTVGGGYQSFIGLGVDRLTSWFRSFGLGARSGLDLPGEAAGFVPSKEWKERMQGEHWFVGDTYNLSIGQGDLLVTPLQVAAYTSAIANGGSLVTPHLVQAMSSLDGDTRKLLPLMVKRRTEQLADANVIQVVREGMRDNVTYGSGRSLSTLPFPAAGKTGTAQWNSQKKTHAWFTAFAPYDKPEIVITVLLEEGGEGSSVSVPVAKQILQGWWQQKQTTATINFHQAQAGSSVLP